MKERIMVLVLVRTKHLEIPGNREYTHISVFMEIPEILEILENLDIPENKEIFENLR